MDPLDRASDGTPISGIAVMAQPAEEDSPTGILETMSGRFALAQTDEDGGFRILDLAPGSYRVSAGRAFGPFTRV